MKVLSKNVPARVCAAALRTSCNGWCTNRRFQNRSCCLFNCGACEDSIEHYVHCSIYLQFTRLHLGLSPNIPSCLGVFIGLSPRDGDDESAQVLGALGVYAAYETHLARRHAGRSATQARDALVVFARQGAHGNAKLVNLLAIAGARCLSVAV